LRLDAERGHAEHLFTFDAQRLPARSQHTHIKASREQGVDERGASVEEVFAIVEYNEHAPLSEVAHQTFDACIQEVEPEASSDSLAEQLGVRERSQINKEDTLGEVLTRRTAASRASRVLPHPPMPVRVTNWRARRRSHTSVSSSWRPRNEDG